ncbi:hypothetical protein D918_06934 [Trichuris suis]|nr:hypothetical protein D918_06934 [Trichuris suis]
MHDRSDSKVDYTPNDFRRSFDIINQAALSSQAYPQGGIRVRQQGDATLITEHRDPYSFYWHLDKSSKRDDDSFDQPARDNIVEEYYATGDFA